MSRRLATSLLLATTLSLGSLSAHDPGLSSARLTVRSETIDTVVSFDGTDVLRAVPTIDLNRDGKLDAAEIAASSVTLRTQLLPLLELRIGGVEIEPTAAGFEAGEGDDLDIRLRYQRTQGSEIDWRVSLLDDLARGHRQYAAFETDEGEVLTEALLRRGANTLHANLEDAGHSGGTSHWAWFGLGVEHILIGYDHILFLLAILLLGSSLRDVATVITSFTIAHSVTLGLATLQVVDLPGLFVEAAIAASIIWVGIENLVFRQPKHRWRTTFAFGLVHGFGFASVLGDLGIGSAGAVVVPLLSFNLGVEVGQLAIAAAAIPCIAWLRQRSNGRTIVTLLSSAVVAAGAFWLVERTLLA